MALSVLDKLVGTRIRREAVGCPHCGCTTLWHGVREYREHLEACRAIAALKR